jgi:phage-related protein
VELAVAYVSIIPETSKIARGVKEALRGAQVYADRNPINVKANIDVSHIGAVEIPVIADMDRFNRAIRNAATAKVKLQVDRAQLRQDVSAIDNLHANVKLRTTNADVQQFGTDLNEKLRRRRFIVHLIPAVDEEVLRRRLSSLPEGTIKLNLDVTTAEINRFSAYLRARLASANITVPIRLELQGESIVRTRIEALTRDRSVNVDVDRSALDRLRGIGSALSGLSVASAGAAAVGAGIAAIGGAAGAALGAVGALGAGLAALGPAAAAGVSTALVGMQGIKDTFKALSAAEDAAGTDGKAQAKAVQAAQEQVVSAYEQRQNAIEGVQDAQRTLTSAEKDARDATNDIADAYKDARQELEDYTFKVKDAALSEAEAKQALIEAREEFAKAPPKDREKAYLRLQRADLRYQEAVEKNKDTQQEANEAFQKGVEASDKVVAAKDKAAQANDRVAEAQRGVEKANQQVEKANRQVEQAQRALTEATTSTSSAQTKAAQELAKLSPEARAFVLATRDLAPAWKDLKNATQDALFADSAKGITELAHAALPTLKAGMVDVAASMNGLTKQFAAFWAAPENLEGVRAAFAGTRGLIDGLGPGLQQATTGFLSLGQAAEPVANKIGAQFGGMLGQIGQAFTTTFQNGRLTELISSFGDTLEGLGQGLNPLIQGLIEMGNVVGPTLGPFLKTLGESLGALGPSLGQLGATFTKTLTSILPDLSAFISALATGLEPVLPVIGDLLRSMMTALTPLIGPLSQITQVVGNALVQAIDALAPAIGPLGTAFASLVTAVAPILPVVAEVVSGLVQALAPALTAVFDALGPVIKQWADLMMPVFRQIQPVLADVAMKIGTALADALQQIAPVLPQLADSFSQLVIAIVPLLPPMAELIAQVLPPMIDLLIELLPAITKIIDAFTWLANNVITPVLIPAIKGLSQYLTDQFNAASDVVRTARDVIGLAVQGMAAYFTDLGKTVKGVWDGIVRSIAWSVKQVGELLQSVPTIHIPGTDITIGEGVSTTGDNLVAWANAHMATGGLLRGPGSGTSDSMLIAASTGEYIVNAKSTAANLPLLQAINAGWVPSADFLHALVPGFREGGQVPGKKFAQSMDPAKYLMGGFSRQAIDCSGLVAAVVNDALGLDPFSGRMSTVNEGAWLAAKGAKPGVGPSGSINIGWFDRGGGANGHTALTLGDGTNVESNGSDGVVIGGPVGANHKMFDKHMYIPPELLRGGDLGGPATGNGAAKGGRPGKLGGGAGGSGASGGASSSGAPGSSGQSDSTGATPVLVTNWPPSFGGPAATDQLVGATPGMESAPTTPASPLGPDGTYTLPPAPQSSAVTPNAGADSTHPLSNLPVPGVSDLFQGPAPWYLAATPEQALANLGSQAAGLAQRTGTGFVDLLQNNWKEMLNTGLAVAGMGAGAGGPQQVVNNYGMDPNSAAAAAERQWRRRTLANQRGGGFGR